MRTLAIAAAACAALLAGCETTPKQLEATGPASTAYLSTPPATSFRLLTTAARECFADKAFRVEADFFPDVRQGHVTIGLTRATATLATARLTPSGEGTTMQLFYQEGWRDVAEKGMLAWAKGEPGYCVTDAMQPRPRADQSRSR